MRLIQISVPEEQQEKFLSILKEYKLGYTITPGAGEQSDHVVIAFTSPADAVEHVLDDLEEVGFDRQRFTVSLNAEFANFEHVDEVQNTWTTTPTRLAPAALRSKSKDLRRNSRSYTWMMILSAVVATAGLLMESPAVVVGSMVIAPIVSPVLTACVGTVRNDREMFLNSIHMQVFGLGVAIATAAVIGGVIRQFQIVPVVLAIEQLELVAVRLAPGILAIVVGLSAGAAGAYGLATKGEVTIVGVMIAAALIPTAAAAGIGLAWGNFVVAIGATLLLVLSMVGVNIGGTAMLLYLDYRPDEADENILTYNSLSKGLVLAITLLVVIAAVAMTGITFYQQSSFEQGVNNGVSDVLSEGEYQELSVMSTTVEYRATSISDETMVTITLSRTSDESYPELPDRLAQSISERTDEPVVVQVRYVDFEQSERTE